METIYTIEYFINKLSVIPENNWYVGDYENPFDSSQKCAAGWCGGNKNNQESVEATKFYHVFSKLGNGLTIADVNDGKTPLYQQHTPKQRIMSALYDIYEKIYGRKYQQPVEPREKVIYKSVLIDSAVKELQEKILTEN